jgi:transketolase
MKELDQLCVNTIHFLAIDAVEKANSGHPGMPLGAAPMAYVLWDRFLCHNPKNPRWFNRDRFILSAGHGLAMLYALLHLYGYDHSLADLRNFRQWDSKTPSHPEYGITAGMGATTGPLGQGFAMGAIVNGMALHGGSIPYGATFLAFSDYMQSALRMAAIMVVHAIFIITHDSIALVEDGPAHQPVEQLMSLRAIPGLTIIRPADANETAIAWWIAVERSGPVTLILTRQKVPILDPKLYPISKGVPQGAYTLVDAERSWPDFIIIATGSEVHLALAARIELNNKGFDARVVSISSWELFQVQPVGYRREIFQRDVPKLAVEASLTLGWYDYLGDKGNVVGLDRFGASSPGRIAYEKLGFSVRTVVERALALIGNGKWIR